jgi:hypothetical protein
MMKTLPIIVICIAALLALSCGERPATQKGEKWGAYRTAILDKHGADIDRFKDRLPGGYADGKDITRYDLDQLILGIKIELEHTSNRLIALEIAADHLEEIPDYYTRLEEMEERYEREVKASKK